MKRSFKLEFCRMHGHICWRTITKKPGCTSYRTHRLNPFPRILNDFRWYKEYLLMRFTHTLYKRCQGCGTGIAEYKIRDPNHGHGNEWLNCCKQCVNFYGIRWPHYKIIGWKNHKSIGKRF